ncbi:DUF726-domain-containing protein [Aaosphaeria arxii CBS 175.79]|uniref:DUF726-domain-containing protein n=1 Tax=Aaosphaeria arxii CBS 175.79 TaxID=1450172 RepID=A0A6A5XYG9_9PLEO|nr:DUF726-domain-containing protein [Aaosphaeria arxii CBS 175.79]KAF2018355.1 DUF726-domain-containing protein [Aaosphaeria arxii CBS 175.79]
MVLFKMANVITGAGPEAAKPDEGASLTTVLDTPTLRVELALLVLLCTDAMRADLLATFDPNKTHETTTPPSGNNATGSGASKSRDAKPATSPVHDLISFDGPQDEAAQAAERAFQYRRQEVESTQMQGLRRGALTFFDKWRAGVMHRVCDVLCVRGEVVRQAKVKRKAALDEAERARQGNSLLIDFGGDPFESKASPSSKRGSNGKKTYGHYDVIENKLLEFEEPKRVLVLHCVLLLLLSLEHYPAHSRVLLMRLASSFILGVDLLAEHEKTVAQGLLASAASQMDAEESAKKQAANDSASSKWKIGLAAVGGAVLIGVTGGLAAPLLAAGVGTVMGGLGLGAVAGLLGTLAGSSVLVGSLFGAYGGKMTGRIMRQYAREVEDFEFIPVRDPERPSIQRAEEWTEDQEARDPEKREQHRLRVSIGISGWLNSPSDVNKPWEVVDSTGSEPFALRFELDSMLRMGNSLNDVLFSYAWDGVTYTVVSQTLLGALYAGLWPLGLVKAASVLDNPFSVAIARADKAGKVMARALMDKVQGERPVTLMGYSIGARVIYSCLVELAEQNAFGLVESVILMGAPVPSDSRTWRQIRSVVAARVVNVFSTEDYILGFLYRSTKLQMGVAGLQEVRDVYGVENLNVSKLVNGHDRYRFLVGKILVKAEFGDIDFNKVAEQERALEISEQKKKRAREHVKRHNKDSNKQDPSTETATNMIVVSDRRTPELGRTEHTPTAERAASFPAPRPFIQQRPGGQQPFVRNQSAMPEMNRLNSAPATVTQSSLIDLTADAPPTTSPSSSSFDFASASSQRNQVPSNMVPTPAAPPQQRPSVDTDSEDEHKIQMIDIDSQKFSPPLEEMLRTPKPSDAPKTTPIVSVNHAESEDESEEEDVSSEFGELSMVDPEPLADGDFGLMDDSTNERRR